MTVVMRIWVMQNTLLVMKRWQAMQTLDFMGCAAVSPPGFLMTQWVSLPCRVNVDWCLLYHPGLEFKKEPWGWWNLRNERLTLRCSWDGVFCLWLVDGAREGNSNWIIAIGCVSFSFRLPLCGWTSQNWLLGKCPTVYTIWGCKETVAHYPFQFIQNNMASAGVLLWCESMYCYLSNSPAEGPKQTLCLHFGKCLVPWFLCTKIGERLVRTSILHLFGLAGVLVHWTCLG